MQLVGHTQLRAFRWGVAALIGAIVADLAEDIVDPANSGEAARIFDAAAHHHGRMIASAVFLLATSAFVVPAVFSLVLRLEGRGRRIGRIAAGLALLGAMGHAALAALYLTWAEIPAGEASRAQLVATIDRITDSPSLAIVVPLFIAFPLSLVATFIALIRAGAAPRWVVLPVAAAPLVAVVGSGSNSLATGMALVLLLVAALGLASRVLQTPQADAAPRSAPAPLAQRP